MGLTLVTPPSVEPVSLAEAKAQCEYLQGDRDTYFQHLIRTATVDVEEALSLSLMTQTWRLTMDAFSDAIELPRGPVQSVASVQYLDAEGITQTVPAADYTPDLVSSPSWIIRNSTASWPATLNAVNVVMVEYVAGYDVLPSRLEALKHAILIKIQMLFERGADPRVAECQERAFDALIQKHRRIMV